MANREQRRKSERSMQKLDIHGKATEASQHLLDAAGIIVQHAKSGDAPNSFEVLGMATIILNEVFQEITKELGKESEQEDPEL